MVVGRRRVSLVLKIAVAAAVAIYSVPVIKGMWDRMKIMNPTMFE